MPPTGQPELCRRCGYAIPSTLAHCPGCSRSRRRRPLRAPSSVRHAERPGAPYGEQKPRVAAPRPATPLHAAPAPYRSLLPLAVPLRSLLRLAAVGAMTVAAAHVARLGITVVSTPWPADRPDDLWGTTGTVATAAAAVTLVVVAITAGLFMVWGVRAYQNLPGLGIDNRRYWTIWLVAGWFIPGANLFVPKLLMADVWRASSPSLPLHPGPSWQRRPVGDVINRWWVLWLTGPAVTLVVAGLVSHTPDAVTEVRLWEAVGVVAGAALAGSARAAAEMTGIITVAQARRSDVFRLVAA